MHRTQREPARAACRLLAAALLLGVAAMALLAPSALAAAPPPGVAPGNGTTVVVLAVGAIGLIVSLEVLARRLWGARKAESKRTMPREIRRTSLIVGLATGTGLLSWSFLGVMITPMAAGLNSSEERVTGAAALGPAVVFGITLLTVARRRGLAPRWRTVAGFLLAAVNLLAVALAPNVWWLYGAAFLGVLPLTLLNYIRPELSRRYRLRQWDGSYQALSRAWGYVTLTAGMLVMGAITSAIPTVGWRIAVGALAAWDAGVGLMLFLWRDLPTRSARAGAEGLPPPAQISLGDLWRVMRVGEVGRSLLAMACAGAILQMVWLSLEPWLAGLGLGTGAALAVGAAGLLRLVALRWILVFGALSNYRVRRATALAATWLGASGALALLTITTLGPLAATLVAAVVAVTAVEIGAGPLNASSRVYVTGLASEADLIATLVSAVAAYMGALLASLLSWEQVVSIWFGLALVAVLVTRRRKLTSTAFRKEVFRSTHLLARLRLTAEGTGNARVRLGLLLGNVIDSIPLSEGAMLVVDTPASREGMSPRAVVFRASFNWRARPRRVWRKSGWLFPFARFPILIDGRKYGVGSWRGGFGRWRTAEDGALVLQSPELARSLRAEVLEHAA